MQPAKYFELTSTFTNLLEHNPWSQKLLSVGHSAHGSPVKYGCIPGRLPLRGSTECLQMI